MQKKLLENLNLIFRPPKNGPDDASPLAATGPGNLLPLWLCVVYCPRTVTVYNKGTYIYIYIYICVCTLRVFSTATESRQYPGSMEGRANSLCLKGLDLV